MDPVNFQGAQNIPSDSKSCAGIRSPTGCPYCGLKDYPQNIPQAYSFTALCPGLSKCKHSQDRIQDDFAIPHPVFSGFPFQHHFFHNSKMPPNFCCFQKFQNDEGKNHCQRQSKKEHEETNLRADHGFCPEKEKTAHKDTEKKINEDAQKNNHVYADDTSLPYTNSIESHLNSSFKRCVCGDSMPWAYSPFFVPVLSYCLLWNSQAASSNILPKTYNGYLTENPCEKKSENLTHNKYSPPNESQEQLHPVKQSEEEKAAVTKSDESTETIFYSQECFRIDRLSKTEMENEEPGEITNLSSGKSSAVISDTLNTCERIDSKDGEQEEINEDVKNYSDDTFEEEEAGDSEMEDYSTLRDETPTEEGLRPCMRDKSSTPELDENPSKSGSLDPESYTNLKSASKTSEQSLDDSSSENKTNVHSPGAIDSTQASVSNFESEEKNLESEDPDTSKTNIKEGIPFKKCIKNFTLTDKINGVPDKEVPGSAAGDVGGESSEDCTIQNSESDENKINEPPEEKFETKELFKAGVATEENESMVSLKLGDENQPSVYKYKTGIAKYVNSNSKASQVNVLKSPKNSKNDKKQNSMMKHRLCLLPNENANDIHPRVQKAKTSVFVQTQATGPEVETKFFTRRLPKKEIPLRKVVRPVVAPSNSSKKAVKPQ